MLVVSEGELSAYDHIGGPKMVHAVCWSHARRKFVDAVKLHPLDVAATRIVKRMDDLFAIDAAARAEKMDHAARHALRLGKAPALLDDMRVQILAAQKTPLPKSATGKAASYALASRPVIVWSMVTGLIDLLSVGTHDARSTQPLCDQVMLASRQRPLSKATTLLELTVRRLSINGDHRAAEILSEEAGAYGPHTERCEAGLAYDDEGSLPREDARFLSRTGWSDLPIVSEGASQRRSP